MTDPRAVAEAAAGRVRDPLTGRSVAAAGMLEGVDVEGEDLVLTVRFTADHGGTSRARVRDALLRQAGEAGWPGGVRVREVGDPPAAPPKDPVPGMTGPGTGPHGGPFEKRRIPGVRHVVAVASGKGGVGKSTVAVNLAVELARRGHAVGLMDADIYGPSLPTMLALRGRVMADAHERILPLEKHGVRCMSIGFLVDEGEPVIWRGPMVMGLVKQFIQDVHWGELDVLVIDLPPGTGDAQLTMIQTTPLSGAVVVTTPQKVAVLDALRGIEMFRKLDVPVIGIVENMSWIELPGGGRATPFGEGGGREVAERYDVPLIAQVPLDGAVRAGGDEGRPAVLDETAATPALRAVADAVAGSLGLS